jgi:hypothetical protein
MYFLLQSLVILPLLLSNVRIFLTDIAANGSILQLPMAVSTPQNNSFRAEFF